MFWKCSAMVKPIVEFKHVSMWWYVRILSENWNMFCECSAMLKSYCRDETCVLCVCDDMLESYLRIGRWFCECSAILKLYCRVETCFVYVWHVGIL